MKYLIKKVKLTKLVFILLMLVSIPIIAKATDEPGEQNKQVLEKIEIVNSNTELTVGKPPTLSAQLKDIADDVEFSETFMSLNRYSTLSTTEGSSDEDGLIKDYIYYHIFDISINDDANILFDQNTKVYVNGVEKKPAYVSEGGTLMVVANESEKLYPIGYIEPAFLTDDFAKAQSKLAQEIVLRAIRAGKVKYGDEHVQQAVEDALATGKEISIELGVSETMTRSQMYAEEENFFDDVDAKITGNQKLGAYYDVGIIVYIDGYIEGIITEIDEPVSVTLPIPNGLPKLENGYKRVWKVIRYHNGVAEVLDAETTENGIKFSNNKFSHFATAYEVVKAEDAAPTEQKNCLIQLLVI